MTEERFLVTGALGCIGAWVVRNLVREGVSTTIFDPGSSLHRLRLIMTEEEVRALPIIASDIGDLAAVERAVNESGATHLIHLAALQVPMCKADPALGARVNVLGTVNVFEAAKRAGIKHIVYASSIAVYGLSEDYPEGALSHDAALKPRTHYGVYKQANEGTARVYWLDEGISSIGLRPYIVYGPGRDQGLTSAPTKAMLAAACGKPYHIPYGGRSMYQYADDAARIFIRAARAAPQSAEAYNLRGSVVRMSEIVAAIERAVPGSAGQITFDDKQLPFPEEMEDKMLTSLLGSLEYTTLDEGVAQTIRIFQQAGAAGHLSEN